MHRTVKKHSSQDIKSSVMSKLKHELCYVHMVSAGIIFCLQSSFTYLKQQPSKEMLIGHCHLVSADF